MKGWGFFAVGAKGEPRSGGAFGQSPAIEMTTDDLRKVLASIAERLRREGTSRSSIGFDSLDAEYAYYSALHTVARCIDEALRQPEVIAEDDITDEFKIPEFADSYGDDETDR